MFLTPVPLKLKINEGRNILSPEFQNHLNHHDKYKQLNYPRGIDKPARCLVPETCGQAVEKDDKEHHNQPKCSG